MDLFLSNKIQIMKRYCSECMFEIDDNYLDYNCPKCMSTDSIIEIKEEINYFSDKYYLDNLEKSIYPFIEIIEDKLIISVWNPIFKNKESTYIKSIDIYDETGELIEMISLFENDEVRAYIEYFYEEKFEIRLNTNFCGIWSSWILCEENVKKGSKIWLMI